MAYWQKSDGSQIYYETYGARSAAASQKEALLLLPGLLGTVSQWQNFTEPLAAGFFLILADLPGHGRSENAALSLQPDRVADDLLGLLDYLDVDAAHLAGYSFGGYTGLVMHLAQPQRVRSLLLHAVKFYWNAEALGTMLHQLDPNRIAQKVPNYANQLAADHGASRWRPLVRQVGDLVAFIAGEGLNDESISRVQCPVLVSVGDRDELIPLQEAFWLSRAVPSGALAVLPGVHHPFQSVTLIPFLPMMQKFFKDNAGIP